MTDLFREVDEAVREDRLKTWAKRYGGWVLTGVLALVVGVVGFQLWQGWEARARHAETQQLLAGVSLAEQAPAEAAEALSALATQAGDGRATLAQIFRANSFAEAGDRDTAIAVYRAVAGDGSVDPLWRDYATLMAVAHDMATGDPAALAADLDRLVDSASPWRYSAREMKGALALQQGDRMAALAAFRTLAEDPETPRGMRGRARNLVDHLDG